MKTRNCLILVALLLLLTSCGKTASKDNNSKGGLKDYDCKTYEMGLVEFDAPEEWTVENDDDDTYKRLRFYSGDNQKLLVMKFEDESPEYIDYEAAQEGAEALAGNKDLVVKAEDFSEYGKNDDLISGYYAQYYSDQFNDGDNTDTIDAYMFWHGTDAYGFFMVNDSSVMKDMVKTITFKHGEAAGAELESIEAEYNGPTEDGTEINQDSDFTVTAVYSDGFQEYVDDWQLEKTVTLKTATTSKVSVTYKDKKTTVSIDCDIPTEYTNALVKAQQYSDSQYMSKNRLYQQLTSEYGEAFDEDAAKYAIENVEADWNYNALQKAKSYQSQQNMSKSRIYEQLKSEYGEGFTEKQAQYAVDHLDD